MKQLALHVLLILVIAGSIFFTNLGKSKLWDRDEPRNAGCAVEMLSRGNYIVPTFNGQLRHQKPVLLYWLMISAYQVFGINEFAARFWSALLAVGTVFATYGIGRRLFNPTAGLLAAIILSTTIMFDVAARAATPDSLLIFCSTIALLIYVLGTFAPKEVSAEGEVPSGAKLRNEGMWFPASIWVAIGMYSVMAVGVLAKGPVGFILPCAIIGMFLLINRLEAPDKNFWESQGWLTRTALRLLRPFHPWHFLKTVWAMRPFTLILSVLVIAAPWYVWVGISTQGDFISQFFIGEHFGRATSVLENHSGGWWFYPVAILVGFFPWSIFWFTTLLSADRSLTAKNGAAPAVLFLLCWVGVQVGLFTLSQTKLPSYVTPCYPALAVLVAAMLHSYATGKTSVARVWFLVSYAGLIVGGLLMTGGLGYLSWKVLGGSWWLMAFGAAPLIAGIVALALAWHDRARDSVFAMTAGAVAVSFALFGFGTMTISQYQNNDQILAHIFGTEPDVKVASYRCLESSWVVYSQKPIYELALETQPDLDTLVINNGYDQMNGGSYPDNVSGSYVDGSYANHQFQSAGPFDSLDPSGAILPEGHSLPQIEAPKWWRAERKLTPEEFSQENPRAVFITSEEHVQELMDRLPTDYEVIAASNYFLQNTRLALIVRRNSQIAQNVYAETAARTAEQTVQPGPSPAQSDPYQQQYQPQAPASQPAPPPAQWR
ncbi:MAG: glycosyltransferase family 39 protein [Planctomycetota bacterium]